MAYKKEEFYEEKITAAIAAHYKEILRLLGEDPEREGLVKTPERVAKALQFLTHGTQQDGSTDGPGQGYRALLDLRASCDAIHRKSSCGIYS